MAGIFSQGFDPAKLLEVATPVSAPEILSIGLLLCNAGEYIGGHRAVRVNAAGMAYHASNIRPPLRYAAGISVNAANIGNRVLVRVSGVLQDLAFNWNEGPVWLGDNGVMTQTLPTTGTMFLMGVGSGTWIIIRPRLIATLS